MKGEGIKTIGIENFSSISDFEIVNPEFAKVKIRVCYAGENRNGSSISKETLDEMSKTIYGVPVIGEYDKDNKCFKGHGGKIEISDECIDWVQTTVPYGFVDTTPVFYETVKEIDGITEHDYLCCYAYLWYKRYPELEEALKNQDSNKIGQSMEISVEDYNYTDKDVFEITKGHFSALCMLGVEPCFESAEVTSRFSKGNLEERYQEMIESFKKYTLDNTGETVIEEPVVEPMVEEPVVEPVIDEPIVEEPVVDYEVKYNEVLKELGDLKVLYTDLQSKQANDEKELEELRAFKQEVEYNKHVEEVNTALSVYVELEEVEGYSELVKDKYTVDLDELIRNIKIFCFDNNIVLGKKTRGKFSKDVKAKVPYMGNDGQGESDTNPEWAFMSKYKTNR